MSKVLIVEDDATLAAIIVDVLKEGGLGAQAVSSGVDALDTLKQDSEFTTVLADLRLRGQMSGIELLRSVRAVEPRMRCILMSGDIHRIDEELEDIEVLAKPIRMKELLARYKTEIKAPHDE